MEKQELGSEHMAIPASPLTVNAGELYGDSAGEVGVVSLATHELVEPMKRAGSVAFANGTLSTMKNLAAVEYALQAGPNMTVSFNLLHTRPASVSRSVYAFAKCAGVVGWVGAGARVVLPAVDTSPFVDSITVVEPTTCHLVVAWNPDEASTHRNEPGEALSEAAAAAAHAKVKFDVELVVVAAFR